MQVKTQRSEQLFQQALAHLPGGVNSPVRSFKAVGGTPRFIQSAKGAYLYDCDNNSYIDYVGSFGPMILGHAHPAVIDAVTHTAQNGLSFGAPSELETLLAQAIKEHMPNIEKCRMVNSGTEATMTAIRLARGITQRPKYIQFEGAYHGHGDSFLVQAGSGALTLGIASSPGVPASTAQNTLVANYNDIDSVSRLFEQYPNEIAAIIIEPIAGNMNMIKPKPDFLKGLREICDHHQALLIFDEVMTGFRVHIGGAQTLYNITPDLTTLGKIIGGGMPVGAIGGKQQYMDQLAPLGPVYQAGTLSGNPICMAAGLATLKQLQPKHYDQLNTLSHALVTGMINIANDANIPLTGHYEGGMFGLFFLETPPATQYKHVLQTNLSHFRAFFDHMLNGGIYFAPSPYEAGFISLSHNMSDIEQTLACFAQLSLK